MTKTAWFAVEIFANSKIKKRRENQKALWGLGLRVLIIKEIKKSKSHRVGEVYSSGAMMWETGHG